MKELFFHYFSPLFFFAAFLFFMYSVPVFHLQNVQVVGTEKISSQAVSEIATDNLTGRYFRILDRDHAFFYPKEKIIQQLLDSYPRIKTVETKARNWWRDLEVTIKERKEKYLYCEEETEIVDEEPVVTEECHFMDEEGQSFDLMVEERELIKFYGPLGKYQEQMVEIEKILGSLGSYDLIVEQVRQDELGNLFFHLKGGTKILLEYNFSADKIIERLRVILSYHDFVIDREEQTFENRIYYVNLRHGNKIYYCLNDLTCAGNY